MKPLYEYIFDMLNYADALIPRIQPDEYDMGNYFMTLLYIEDILDKYGRSLVMQSGVDAGKDGHKLMIEATARMDQLRIQIKKIAETYDFDPLIKSRTDVMYRDWSGIFKKS